MVYSEEFAEKARRLYEGHKWYPELERTMKEECSELVALQLENMAHSCDVSNDAILSAKTLEELQKAAKHSNECWALLGEFVRCYIKDEPMIF